MNPMVIQLATGAVAHVAQVMCRSVNDVWASEELRQRAAARLELQRARDAAEAAALAGAIAVLRSRVAAHTAAADRACQEAVLLDRAAEACQQRRDIKGLLACVDQALQWRS